MTGAGLPRRRRLGAIDFLFLLQVARRSRPPCERSAGRRRQCAWQCHAPVPGTPRCGRQNRSRSSLPAARRSFPRRGCSWSPRPRWCVRGLPSWLRVAMPRLRSTTMACSISPFASVSAFLQSIMGAPDFSRSSLTIVAVISAIAKPFLDQCGPARPGSWIAFNANITITILAKRPAPKIAARVAFHEIFANAPSGPPGPPRLSLPRTRPLRLRGLTAIPPLHRFRQRPSQPCARPCRALLPC